MSGEDSRAVSHGNVQTETVETAYGDVEVDLAECDSCGNQVRVEDTVEFTIGDREGLACKYCRDEGPMSFPEKHGVEIDVGTDFLAFMTAFSPLLTVFVLADLDEEMDADDAAMAGMFIGGMFWLAVGLLVVSPPARNAVISWIPL
jgi:hypothetical protein